MSSPVATTLSKSRYISGLQCAKRLWTEVHARELIPPVGLTTQARFDAGHEVGDLAKKLFPGGLEIGPGVRRWDRVVEDTRRALSQRRPLYEAAFRQGGAACRVDILAPASGDSWDVYEVKSSTRVKKIHHEDLALQAYVLESAGIEVRDYFVVHLDSSYVRDGDLDLQRLFHKERVTEIVQETRHEVEARLGSMREILAMPTRPVVPIGVFCHEPYSCPLLDECWAFLPPASVFDLTRGRSMAFELLQEGIHELREIPLTADLNSKQRVQLETVRSGLPHVDLEALEEFLSRLTYPVSYFDIETLGSAIPLYDESSPYQQIPFLFSIHRQEEPGQAARHYTYMYDGHRDPRPDFLRAARTSLGEAGSIVAYNAPFELGVLQACAAGVGAEFEAWVAQSAARFVDLLSPFRKFSYHHPDQLGSASLKAVLTPLTGLTYSDLEIAQGEVASVEYRRVMAEDVDPRERARVLRQLEAYCSLDTFGMVAIIKELQALLDQGVGVAD